MVVSRTNREGRLTCNRIFRHLYECSMREFSGRLEVQCLGSEGSWSLYLDWGRVIWVTGGEHPRRRWYRQLCWATGKKPRIPEVDVRANPCWDYQELSRLSQAGLSEAHVRAIIRGVVAEVLFDIVHAYEQPLIARTNSYSSMLDISVLAGAGDDLQITTYPGEILGSYCLPPSWHPPMTVLQKEVWQAWQQWVKWGLGSRSPNRAPSIRDAEALQSETTPKAFQNLSTLLDGNRTLRDISLRCKHNRDPYRAGQGLAPHIQSRAIALDRAPDLLEPRPLATNHPLVVCVDRDCAACEKLEFLATEAGFQFVSVSHPFEALYQFERQQLAVPSLMFVAADLLPLSGQEFCSLLRRLPALRSVPIVFHSREPLSPERRQELAQLDSVILSGSDFSTDPLLDVLLARQPGRPSASGRRRASVNELETQQTMVDVPAEYFPRIEAGAGG